MSSVGEVVRRVRTDRKETQAQFAEALGFSRAETVSNWERGASSPDLDTRERIARLARKSYAEVWGGIDAEVSGSQLPQRGAATADPGLSLEAQLAGIERADVGELVKVLRMEAVAAAYRAEAAAREARAAEARARAAEREGAGLVERAKALQLMETGARERVALAQKGGPPPTGAPMLPLNPPPENDDEEKRERA